MKCEEVQKRLWLYAELSGRESEIVDKHLRTCRVCQAELQRMKKDHELVARAFPRKGLDHPQIFTNRVMAAIASQAAEVPGPAGFLTVFNLFRAVMTAFSLVLISFFVQEAGKDAPGSSPASIPVTNSSVVLNSSAFLERIKDRHKTGDLFLSCVKTCREQPEELVCESCLEKIKNITL